MCCWANLFKIYTKNPTKFRQLQYMCTQSKANFWGPIQLLSFTVQALVPLLILNQFWNNVRIWHMICFLRLKHWKMSPLSLGEWVRHMHAANPIGQILFRWRGALVFVQLSMGLHQNSACNYRVPASNAQWYATSSPTFHLLLFIFSLISAICCYTSSLRNASQPQSGARGAVPLPLARLIGKLQSEIVSNPVWLPAASAGWDVTSLFYFFC